MIIAILVAALTLWSSELMADDITIKPGDHSVGTPFRIISPVDRPLPAGNQTIGDVATKADLDALNKRLDVIERMIRCIVTDPKACD
jgi:hypothetical protein